MIRARSNKHLWIWGVAAILFAAAFLLVFVRPGSAADTASTVSQTPPIDTAGPVDPTQCAPCHLDLGSVDKPGLIFSHGNHLMVSCDGCHSRMPHNSGATDSVPMDVCFACHGVKHGPQGELATSDCRKCHPASYNLVPRDHEPQAQFSGKPHAELSKRAGVNGCMMCHTATKDCNPCHAKQNVNIPAQRGKGPSIKIYPSGPTNMAQCVYCHPDLDRIIPGRLIFAHAAHLQRGFKCEACHPKFGHSSTGAAKPDMMSCYRCHGLQHQGQGVIAGDDCPKCHPPGFKLVPANHTPKFIQGEHKARAVADPSYCAMCHTTKFCVDCHTGHGTGPNAPKQPVVPVDHSKTSWINRHGKLYLAKQGDCGACHDDASCKKCHKTTMPHPPGWIGNHKPEPGVSSADCNICHTDRQACQNCHHQKVQNAELVASACIGCHPEMGQLPATSIPNKGFAEHAVHFSVAKKKGRPYRCFECHVSFGQSQSAQTLELQQGHDLRLCYQCHGAVDPFGAEIAPFYGAALCLRCHKNLGV